MHAPLTLGRALYPAFGSLVPTSRQGGCIAAWKAAIRGAARCLSGERGPIQLCIRCKKNCECAGRPGDTVKYDLMRNDSSIITSTRRRRPDEYLVLFSAQPDHIRHEFHAEPTMPKIHIDVTCALVQIPFVRLLPGSLPVLLNHILGARLARTVCTRSAKARARTPWHGIMRSKSHPATVFTSRFIAL